MVKKSKEQSPNIATSLDDTKDESVLGAESSPISFMDQVILTGLIKNDERDKAIKELGSISEYNKKQETVKNVYGDLDKDDLLDEKTKNTVHNSLLNLISRKVRIACFDMSSGVDITDYEELLSKNESDKLKLIQIASTGKFLEDKSEVLIAVIEEERNFAQKSGTYMVFLKYYEITYKEKEIKK